MILERLCGYESWSKDSNSHSETCLSLDRSAYKGCLNYSALQVYPFAFICLLGFWNKMTSLRLFSWFSASIRGLFSVVYKDLYLALSKAQSSQTDAPIQNGSASMSCLVGAQTLCCFCALRSYWMLCSANAGKVAEGVVFGRDWAKLEWGLKAGGGGPWQQSYTPNLIFLPSPEAPLSLLQACTRRDVRRPWRYIGK